MFKPVLITLLAGCALAAPAEQIDFNFANDIIGKQPPGFRSTSSGGGDAAKWMVTEEIVPPLLAPLEPNSKEDQAKHTVLTQQSFDLGENHFPILLYTNEIFSDFTLTTRFKLSGGIVEPSAGLVFRAQDESNYYVVRASDQGNLLWYRVVNGTAYQNLGIGVLTPMPRDKWRELRVECEGTQIRCFLDGKLAIPPVKPGAPTNGVAINDTTFSHGMIGFWSKADTKSFFVDTVVHYTPHVPYIQIVINSVARKHPALLGLKVYANKNPGMPSIIGCMDEHEFGQAGTKTEEDVIERGSIYYLKKGKAVEVTMPLRDRNGDVVGALAIKMKAFKGETESTAVAKATLLKREVELQLETMQDING
jgi:hypothetical protein